MIHQEVPCLCILVLWSAHLVVLRVQKLGQLVEDERRVGNRAAEGMVDRCAQVVGGQYRVGCCKSRPHYEHRVG